MNIKTAPLTAGFPDHHDSAPSNAQVTAPRQSGGGTRRITQTVLAEYLELHNDYQAIKEKREVMRLKLLALAAAGAEVEPGTLLMLVREYSQRPFTRASLSAVLGPEAVAKLAQEVASVECTHLIVKIANDKVSTGTPRRLGFGGIRPTDQPDDDGDTEVVEQPPEPRLPDVYAVLDFAEDLANRPDAEPLEAVEDVTMHGLEEPLFYEVRNKIEGIAGRKHKALTPSPLAKPNRA